METNSATIVSKVWSFCNTLRDDGVSYGDYLEQLTYLLFLKMAHEYSKPPYSRRLPIPKEFNWESLVSRREAELELHYSTLLRDKSLTDLDTLPDPDVLAAGIIENLEVGLQSFREIVASIEAKKSNQ